MADSNVPLEFEFQDDLIKEINQKIEKSAQATEAINYIEGYFSKYFQSQLMELEKLLGQLNRDTAYEIEQEFEVIKKRAESFDCLLANLVELVAEQKQLPISSEPELFRGIVDFPTAIANLEKYGSIIPTESDVKAYDSKRKTSKAGKLILIFLLSNAKKIYRKLQNNETSTNS